jgi:hypothetical protein
MSERAEPLDDDRPLTDLPPARRPLKAVTLALMGLTAFLALWLAFGLRSEAGFALEGSQATDVGPLASADLAPLVNGFVRTEVALAGMPTATFSRPVERMRFRVALVAEGEGAAQRWVVFPVARAMDGPRFEPPALVAGRLVRLGDLGVRFRGLDDRLATLTPHVARDAWVLVDGEDPTNMGWVLALELLLLGFAAFNLLSIARLARRVR